MTLKDGSVLEGAWQNNVVLTRNLKKTDKDGNVYEGEFCCAQCGNMKKNGHGRMDYANANGAYYEGEWSGDRPNGLGKNKTS